jgi:hypothetical protein
VLKRGIMLVSIFYGCWSIMIFNGFATSVGMKIPTMWDVIAAWLAKSQPIIDSVILLQMLSRILDKGKAGNASRSQAGSEAD